MGIFGSKKESKFNADEYLQTSPVASAIINSYAEILKLNEPFIKMAGDDAKKGSGLDNILADITSAEISKAVKRLIAGNETQTTLLIKLKAGQGKAASLIIKYLGENIFGKRSGKIFLATLLDAQEIASLEQKLNHSQKMQAVGQLAGGVAHDFNNLLTAMTGFCDLLLQRHPPGDKSFPDIMQIKQNANRAANLVRQLLAFSRKQVLKPKLIDLTDNLSDLSSLLRRLLGEKVNLEVKHGRDIGKILADPGQIDQVTINLAVNARDAMPAGGTVTIQTSSAKVDNVEKLYEEFMPPDAEDKITEGDYILIQVIDNGTGMSREVLEKIFEPFFSTKEVGAGTGLGLATVYGIVKQTGGFIMVKSAEGAGTEFRIYLKEADESAIIADIAEEDNNTRLSSDLTGTETILIVEDEVPVRIFASRALNNKGYKVLEADSPDAALELVEQNKGSIQLILSDVIMPGMNGPTMVKEIKKGSPDVKVIFMSGYTEDALEDCDIPPEEINFLQKPFTLKDLAAKVKNVLGK